MCELCTPTDVLTDNDLAYARFDSNSLSPGHALIIPRRHVADYFDMTLEEQAALGELLRATRENILAVFAPAGCNHGVHA